MKHINTLIAIFSPFWLIASTNIFNFAFENLTLTDEVKAFIVEDLNAVLAPGIGHPRLTDPCWTPEAMPNCIKDLNQGLGWWPDALHGKVKHILRMPDGKEAVWVTSEASGIYTNKMAEIAENPAPFSSFRTIISRFQHLEKEPLTNAESRQIIQVALRDRLEEIDGNLFSKSWSRYKVYTPSLLWVTRVEEKDYPEFKEMFELYGLPNPDENGYPEYWAFLIIKTPNPLHPPTKLSWGYFNNRWHLFL